MRNVLCRNGFGFISNTIAKERKPYKIYIYKNIVESNPKIMFLSLFPRLNLKPKKQHFLTNVYYFKCPRKLFKKNLQIGHPGD